MVIVSASSKIGVFTLNRFLFGGFILLSVFTFESTFPIVITMSGHGFLMLVIALAWEYFEFKWIYGFSNSGHGASKISNMFYSWAALMLMFSNKIQGLYEKTFARDQIRRKLLQVVVKIGENSFGIYLIHCHFLNFFVTRVADLFILKVILTLVMSVVAIFLVKKILPYLSKMIFGFR